MEPKRTCAVKRSIKKIPGRCCGQILQYLVKAKAMKTRTSDDTYAFVAIIPQANGNATQQEDFNKIFM